MKNTERPHTLPIFTLCAVRPQFSEADSNLASAIRNLFRAPKLSPISLLPDLLLVFHYALVSLILTFAVSEPHIAGLEIRIYLCCLIAAIERPI